MDILFIGLLIFSPFVSGALGSDCDNSDSPLLCHGARVVRNVFDHILNDTSDTSSNFQLLPGLEIVEIPRNTSDNNDNGNSSTNSITDNGYLGRVSRYLQKHELRIKLPKMGQSTDINEVINQSAKRFDSDNEISEGRKKDKGINMVLMLALMMKKMLAALGIAAVGALAAKALGVALLAFLLASLIGIKKLTESSHDEGGHHVQYVTAHTEHHRRRRKREIDESVPLPYRGWVQNAAS